jgi:arylsulfatase
MSTSDRRKPNILWICTDQQRFDTLGCYGNPFVQTPNLDRLAQSGVLFERAFCQNPVCAPSRASFLTGRYPRTTRCRQNGQSIPDSEVLVTRMLADAGYICGLSGKLHISPCNPKACKGTERRIDDGYDEFHWSHHPAPDWPTNEYIHWLQEKGVPYQTSPLAGSRYVRTGMPAEYHQTTWCTQKAIDFIQTAASFAYPWLFSVNTFDPHHAFDPPREYLERYLERLEEIPLPNYVQGELENKPVWQRIDHEGAYSGIAGHRCVEMTDQDHRTIRVAYWAMVDLIDAQVGRMLDALEATGQLDNTIVIFASDHGEMLGDHGIYLKGPYFYEPAVRVPLILSGPGIRSGVRSGALAELADLAPTLLDACGLKRHPGMQARTLWPLLTGETSPDRHRDDVYCEFYGSNFRYDPPAHTTMVRTERYKLTVAHGQNTGELYDLESDPTETVNRWGDPGYVGVRHEMMMRLCDRMAWTADPLPEREAVW